MRGQGVGGRLVEGARRETEGVGQLRGQGR